MNLEFENGTIALQAAAFKWGPFTFDFENLMPTGRTIEAISASTYLGRVKPEDSDVLAAKTETSSELVASVSMLDSYVAALYLNRPTTSGYINANHTVVFTITLDSAGGSGFHTVFFYKIKVL